MREQENAHTRECHVSQAGKHYPGDLEATSTYQMASSQTAIFQL